MTTSEMLKKLADAEEPCPCRECTEVGLGIHSPACDECKGTTTIPVFPMLRVGCRLADSPNIKEHEKFMCDPRRKDGFDAKPSWWNETCPGNRTKTLDEARLCLEELLVAKQVLVAPRDDSKEWVALFITAPTTEKYGDTPTEAVIAALYSR